MRIHLSIALLIMACVSCGETDSPKDKERPFAEQSTLEKSERKDYDHIKLDLYRDSKNNIYHRTIDVSAMVGEGYYRYTSYARMYNETNDNYTCVELNELLDTASFRKVACGMDDGRTTCFEDVNYRYSLYSVADGGVLDAHLRH